MSSACGSDCARAGAIRRARSCPQISALSSGAAPLCPCLQARASDFLTRRRAGPCRSVCAHVGFRAGSSRCRDEVRLAQVDSVTGGGGTGLIPATVLRWRVCVPLLVRASAPGDKAEWHRVHAWSACLMGPYRARDLPQVVHTALHREPIKSTGSPSASAHRAQASERVHAELGAPHNESTQGL